MVSTRELPIDEMLKLAGEYVENSYSPYSGIRVASIVYAKSGKMYPGVNVENASYGLTICAERVAMSNMVTSGEREPLAVVVVSNLNRPLMPCGACAQFIAEFNPNALIIAHSIKTGETKVVFLREIFPQPFRL